MSFASDPAYADNGVIDLSWLDCLSPDSVGTHDMSDGCSQNEGSIPLYCAFQLQQIETSVIGIEVDIDIQTAGPMPDWWQMGIGSCRDGALHASGDFTANTSCADPWNNAGVAADVLFRPGLPRFAPGQAQIQASYAIPSDSARTLEAGTVYDGLQVLVSNQNSVLAGACAGCRTSACLVLNEIRLVRLPGSTPEIVVLNQPGQNRATWFSAVGANCAAVPVRIATWGQLKALYR